MTGQDVMETAARAHMRRLEDDARHLQGCCAYWERRASIYKRDFEGCIKFAFAGWLLAMTLMVYTFSR